VKCKWWMKAESEDYIVKPASVEEKVFDIAKGVSAAEMEG
jgi:hypothetical protein